ncbi:hypothetical protein bcgnr5390_15700 [Bacillus luti]|nr:hypothetical protein BC2903_45880 [Bacillus cereus]
MTIQESKMLASELYQWDVIELIHPFDGKPILCTIYELELKDNEVVITYEDLSNKGFSGVRHLQLEQEVNAIPMHKYIQQKLG